MKAFNLFRSGGVCGLSVLALLVAPSIVGADTRERQTVQVMTAPLGTTGYAVGSALEEMSAGQHAWLRVTNGEGPGCSGSTMNLFRSSAWRGMVGCTGIAEFTQAEAGIEPFDEVDADEMKNDVKLLFNYNNNASGLITTDPNIRTLEDLDGKRVALGRRGQTAFGALAPLIQERGLPDVDIQWEYLGPAEAHSALGDGRVAAAATLVNFMPDRSSSFMLGPPLELMARVDSVYPVSFGEDVLQRAADAGMDLPTVELDADLIPDFAFVDGESPVWINLAFGFAVHREFSEELAYELAKLVAENATKFPDYHAALGAMATPETLVGPWSPENFHPGARRAFREAGLID